jgi:hypothetical protein
LSSLPSATAAGVDGRERGAAATRRLSQCARSRCFGSAAPVLKVRVYPGLALRERTAVRRGQGAYTLIHGGFARPDIGRDVRRRGRLVQIENAVRSLGGLPALVPAPGGQATSRLAADSIRITDQATARPRSMGRLAAEFIGMSDQATAGPRSMSRWASDSIRITVGRQWARWWLRSVQS